MVDHLQLRGDTLVTGASDGTIRVWSLQRMDTVHRIQAHDNSVTDIQFDHRRIVSTGSDGRIKVWDINTGELLRELGTPADTAWKLDMGEKMAVAIRSIGNKTVLEVSSLSLASWIRMIC